MQGFEIRVYLLLNQFVDRTREAVSTERGQAAAEYVGILAFVAAVVAIVLGASTEIGNTLLTKIREAISSITGG